VVSGEGWPGGLFGSAEMRAVFATGATVQSWLDVEAVLNAGEMIREPA
jgi:adenylosuccinate lyase